MTKIELNESELRDVICKAIYKTLNENNAASELDELYRYIKEHQGEEGFGFKNPIRKRNQLCFHFTDNEAANDIMSNGFKYGAPQEHLKNTNSGYHSSEKGKYCFAYNLSTFIHDWYGCSAYGESMIVSIADCVQCRHVYDEDIQCIFIKGTEKPIAAFDLDIERHYWGKDVTFHRLDKEMEPCSLLQLLTRSDFSRELKNMGYDMSKNRSVGTLYNLA